MVTQLPLDGIPAGKAGPSSVRIRLAREDEVETLRQIERSAAQSFRLIEALSWLAVGDVPRLGRNAVLLNAADTRRDDLKLVRDCLDRLLTGVDPSRLGQVDLGELLDLRLGGGVLVLGPDEVELGVAEEA